MIKPTIGMNKEEVYKRLNLLTYDRIKISYLNKILKKQGLLTKKTKDSIYECLIELYLNLHMNGKEYLKSAKGLASETGKSDLYQKLVTEKAEELEKKECFESASELWKDIGNNVRMVKCYETIAQECETHESPKKAAYWWEQAGNTAKAKENCLKYAEKLIQKGNEEDAVEYFVDGGDYRRAVQIYEKLADCNKRASYYSKNCCEYLEKVVKLCEKIGDKEKMLTTCERILKQITGDRFWESEKFFERIFEKIVKTYEENDKYGKLGDFYNIWGRQKLAARSYEKAGMPLLPKAAEIYEDELMEIDAIRVRKKIAKQEKLDCLRMYKEDAEGFINYFNSKPAEEKKAILGDVMGYDFTNAKVAKWLNENYLDLVREVGLND